MLFRECCLILMFLQLVLGDLSRSPADSGWADVTAFGAKGDGKTDDIDAVRTAVAAIGARGGTVYFPPGGYALGAPILLAGLRGVALRGAGAHGQPCNAGSSLLALGPSSSLVIFNQTQSCRIEHLLLSHTVEGERGESDLQQQTCLQQTSLATVRMMRAPLPAKQGVPLASDLTTRVTPTHGAAISIWGAFDTSLTNLWIEHVWTAVEVSEMANTITILDCIVLSIFGPSGFLLAGGKAGARVDIVQISRITTNQQGLPGENVTAVWIDIGAGVNTVRLDNVGLINGGIGVRMDAEADAPAGVAPGRSLFLFGNDLEIDFPNGNAVELLHGESVLLSNSYIQGSKTANGIYVGPDWNSEVSVTNSRIFGNARAGVELAGGVRALLSNNIIGDNSAAGAAISSGVLVRKAVSSFSLVGNHIGPVFKGEATTNHRFGVEIESGASDAYTVVGNVLMGNEKGGLLDGGTGTSKSVANNAGAEKLLHQEYISF